MAVTQIKALVRRVQGSYRPLCRLAGVGYSSFMRWKVRIDGGNEAVQKPGPKKSESLDLETLLEEIAVLKHRGKRTLGVGMLYQKWRGQISRRELNKMIHQTRKRIHIESQGQMEHVEWKVPGLAWSIDGSELELEHVYQVQDLASRYKMKPLIVKRVRGEAVAVHLDRLFQKHGAPLILKRDNGPELNHHAVNAVLSRYRVLPLNSPAYYPPYNGAVERSIAELKAQLQKKIPTVACSAPLEGQLQADLAVHELNHLRRKSLRGRCSCAVFGSRACFKKHQRSQMFAEVKKLAILIAQKLDLESRGAIQTALRVATETWLLNKRLITVTKNKSVTPINKK